MPAAYSRYARGVRLVLVAVLLFACGSPKPPTSPPVGGTTIIDGVTRPERIPQTSTDVKIVVTGTAITLNGVAVSGKPTVAQIEAIFGKPDRTWDSGGMNKVHTWDKLGVLVYEPYETDGVTGNGRCISATFPYKPMSQSFSPATMFSGSFQVDGKALDPTLVLPTIIRWPGATQPYTKASIVFDRGDFHVFTIAEKSGEKGGDNIDLVELSFWQNARGDSVGRVAEVDEDDCKAGDVSRCSSRALALQTGVAGRTSFERAFELVKIACEGGDVFGCVMLGNMHEAGKGTKASAPDAKAAWTRACKLGYKPACTYAK
jgi:hypothetical protein